MLVVDASALAELVLDRPAAVAVEVAMVDHGFDLHAPHIVDVEVASAVRRLVAAGEADDARGAAALRDFLDLPIERYPHGDLLPRVWELKAAFSAYDAAYLALAESLADRAVPMLTADARLGRAIRAQLDLPVLVA